MATPMPLKIKQLKEELNEIKRQIEVWTHIKHGLEAADDLDFVAIRESEQTLKDLQLSLMRVQSQLDFLDEN